MYASFDAFFTAEVTSLPFDKPIQIFHFLFHTKTVALNDNLLHQVVTLVTLLTSNKISSNSFCVLFFSQFSGLIKNNYII
ncbi:MAG: hypothetical protein WCG25_00080 [bacterium]